MREELNQWKMRLFKNLDKVVLPAEYFVNAVSGFRADIALSHEFFNIPLVAEINHLQNTHSVSPERCVLK
jgi:hypothetical protein